MTDIRKRVRDLCDPAFHEEPKGPMLRAKLCIQCTAPDGTTVGSFLFSGHDDSGQRVLASPVFPDLLPLFQWCNANGWKAETVGYLSDYVK